jgi:hypothetical protein
MARCPECGVVVSLAALHGHECDPAAWISRQVIRARPGIARLEDDLAAYLATPRGRFELWYAERTRKRAWPRRVPERGRG